MADSLTCRFDSSQALNGLDRIEAEMLAQLRPAAQAGAKVLYDEVKARVGSIGKITGNLDRSICQVYSADNSSAQRATYHVSWNASKAPHGHLVEYGHIQTRKVYVGSDGNWYTSKEPLPAPKRVAARPFLRPAFDARSRAALEAVRTTFVDGMQPVLK